ncbi:MAG: ATP-binding protein, partial [Planctomycetota bacterium]
AMRRVESVLLDREVAIALQADLPLVSIDAMLVEQLLVNLLENAAKYAQKDRPVEVSARIDGDDLRIAVLDRGKGLDAEERERVFAKFYRGPGQQQRPGAGLGLAICRAVAELHGGTIQCNGRDGGGAEFVARLPLLASTVVPPIGGEPS